MIEKVTNMFLTNEPKGTTLSRQAQRMKNKAIQANVLGSFSLVSGAYSGLHGDVISAPASLLGGALLYKGGEYTSQYKNIVTSEAYKNVVKRAQSIASHSKKVLKA